MKAGEKLSPIVVIDSSSADLFKKLYPEVENVYHSYMVEEDEEMPLTSIDFANITQRIIEDRESDSDDFYVELIEVEQLSDDDDWSDVNNSIENIIKKYLLEAKGSYCKEKTFSESLSSSVV